jgi:hypothetical protein
MKEGKVIWSFFLIFLMIIISISIVSAGLVFKLVDTGDECDDINPGCEDAIKQVTLGVEVINTIIEDDDCNHPNGYEGNVDNPCPRIYVPREGTTPGYWYTDNSKIPGYPKPTLEGGGVSLKFSAGEANTYYDTYVSSYEKGEKIIFGTAYDDDGWNMQGGPPSGRGDGKNCSWALVGSSFQGPPHGLSKFSQRPQGASEGNVGWVDQHNCFLYQVCDEIQTKVRKKATPVDPVKIEDPENSGRFIWTSGECVISDESECAQCVVDSDCTEGTGSDIKTGICCGGSCIQDSQKSTLACCGFPEADNWKECGSIKEKSGVDVDMSNGGCYNAVPEENTHAFPTDETPPEGMVATQYSDSETTIYDNTIFSVVSGLEELKEKLDNGQIIPQIDDVATTVNSNPPFVTFDALAPLNWNFAITENVDGVSARFIKRWSNSHFLFRTGWQTDTVRVTETTWTSDRVWSVTGDANNEGQGTGDGKPTGSWLDIVNRGPNQYSNYQVTYPTFGFATDELNWLGMPHVAWADIIANPADPGVEFGISGRLSSRSSYVAKAFFNPYTQNYGGIFGFEGTFDNNLDITRPSTWTADPFGIIEEIKERWGNNNEEED